MVLVIPWWWPWLLAVFAVYRMAEALTIDTVFLQWRLKVRRWAYGDSGLVPFSGRWYAYKLSRCPLCAGSWLSLAAASFLCVIQSLPALILPLAWLGVAGGQAALAALIGRANNDEEQEAEL